jgi:hypothetical protein
MSKQLLSIKFIVKNSKLTPRNELMKEQYKIFLNTMQEGDLVDCVMELVTPTNTKAQLAKIHACINELAKEQGCSSADMKLQIKDRAGLSNKSFADCSKEQLSQVIEIVIEIGEFLNINFRGTLHQ